MLHWGHTLDFGRSQNRSKAWLWAAMLGNLGWFQAVTELGAQLAERPPHHRADADLRASLRGARVGSMGRKVLENSGCVLAVY